MSAPLTPTAPLPADPESAAPSARVSSSPSRLWLPMVALAVYWILAFLIGSIDKPYFFGFLYQMLSTALLTLVFLAWWWWLNRRIRPADRLLGFLLLVGAGAAVAPFCDQSINLFGLFLIGLPVVLTACTIWMFVAQPLPTLLRRSGMVVVVLLAWSYFALLRLNGLDGDLQSDVGWRWTPSAEELFLREQAAAAGDSLPASPAWAPTVGANDWTGFRGPERDGVLRGVRIATDWKSNPPKRRWRRRVGPAWSSLIVLGDRLFTQEQRGDKEAVVCYDAGTGKPLWVHEDATRFYEAVSGAGPRATPTYADGRLYTLGGTGLLNCLDAATGRPVWSRDILAEAGTKPLMWGYSSSPLIFKDKVIVYAGGDSGKGLLAYHARTGEPLWSAPTGSSYSSPQLTTLAGKPQVLLLHDQGLSGVDPGDGAVLWSVGTPMSGSPRTSQSHAVGAGAVLVGGLESLGVTRVEVSHDGGQWKAEEAWTSRDLKPEFPDLVVHDGHAYGFDVNIFCCIDAATGQRRWKEGRYGRGQVILLPEQALLLVLSEKGQAVLLAASPERHEELGHFQAITGKTWNHPVIAGRRLYARNAEEMACYDLGAAPAAPPSK